MALSFFQSEENKMNEELFIKELDKFQEIYSSQFHDDDNIHNHFMWTLSNEINTIQPMEGTFLSKKIQDEVILCFRKIFSENKN